MLGECSASMKQEANVSIATGGSAKKAIEVLIDQGVKEERILFLNLLASPEGIKNCCDAFPKLTIISGWIDEGLDEKKYIVGLLPKQVWCISLRLAGAWTGYAVTYLRWLG
jgi:hypothetical protein